MQSRWGKCILFVQFGIVCLVYVWVGMSKIKDLSTIFPLLFFPPTINNFEDDILAKAKPLILKGMSGNEVKVPDLKSYISAFLWSEREFKIKTFVIYYVKNYSHCLHNLCSQSLQKCRPGSAPWHIFLSQICGHFSLYLWEGWILSYLTKLKWTQNFSDHLIVVKNWH